MQQEGFKLDAQVYVAALTACSSLAATESGSMFDGRMVKQEALKSGMEIHRELAEAGFDRSDMFAGNTLVDMYAKCGCMKASRRVFQLMRQRDVVSWTALILGYILNGEAEVALELFAYMSEEGRCEPNSATFAAAVKACSSLVSLDKGRRIHEQIRRAGAETELVVVNALIDFYGKCGSMLEAQHLFDKVERKQELVTWNALLAGYSQQGNSNRVWEIVEEMKKERVNPNGITFLHIFSLCSHAGLVEKAKEWFQIMWSDYDIPPRLEHYTCMVDVLGRANRLEEAVAMVRSMPLQPDSKVWITLLGACHKWGNVEIGRFAFDALQRLDDKDPAAYVLMRNIYMYSAAGLKEEQSP